MLSDTVCLQVRSRRNKTKRLEKLVLCLCHPDSNILLYFTSGKDFLCQLSKRKWSLALLHNQSLSLNSRGLAVNHCFWPVVPMTGVSAFVVVCHFISP